MPSGVPLELVGCTFGNLTVLCRATEGQGRGKPSNWICMCACGELSVVRGSHLLQGFSRSCGATRCRKAPDRSLDYTPKPSAPITPGQCRAARGWLGWTKVDLSAFTNVGVSTIANFEAERHTPMPGHMAAIRKAFVSEGLVFSRGVLTARMGSE